MSGDRLREAVADVLYREWTTGDRAWAETMAAVVVADPTVREALAADERGSGEGHEPLVIYSTTAGVAHLGCSCGWREKRDERWSQHFAADKRGGGEGLDVERLGQAMHLVGVCHDEHAPGATAHGLDWPQKVAAVYARLAAAQPASHAAEGGCPECGHREQDHGRRPNWGAQCVGRDASGERCRCRRDGSTIAAPQSASHAAEGEHEHYWVDARDDETAWHCTICGVTEYPGGEFDPEDEVWPESAKARP